MPFLALSQKQNRIIIIVYRSHVSFVSYHSILQSKCIAPLCHSFCSFQIKKKKRKKEKTFAVTLGHKKIFDKILTMCVCVWVLIIITKVHLLRSLLASCGEKRAPVRAREANWRAVQPNSTSTPKTNTHRLFCFFFVWRWVRCFNDEITKKKKVGAVNLCSRRCIPLLLFDQSSLHPRGIASRAHSSHTLLWRWLGGKKIYSLNKYIQIGPQTILFDALLF